MLAISESLPHDVVLEWVVGAHGHEAATSHAEREEDLHGGSLPDLDVAQPVPLRDHVELDAFLGT